MVGVEVIVCVGVGVGVGVGQVPDSNATTSVSPLTAKYISVPPLYTEIYKTELPLVPNSSSNSLNVHFVPIESLYRISPTSIGWSASYIGIITLPWQ